MYTVLGPIQVLWAVWWATEDTLDFMRYFHEPFKPHRDYEKESLHQLVTFTDLWTTLVWIWNRLLRR